MQGEHEQVEGVYGDESVQDNGEHEQQWGEGDRMEGTSEFRVESGFDEEPVHVN